jgi:FkbM family methyltransferase
MRTIDGLKTIIRRTDEYVVVGGEGRSMRLVTKLRTGWRVVQQDGLGAGWALFAQTSPALQTIGRASRVMPFGLLRVGLCLFRADAEAKRFLIAGNYEGAERVASRRFIRRDIPVIDLGGSLGVVSCLINRRLRDPRRHVVVEANPDTLSVLTANRDRNRCRFEIVYGAIGGTGETTPVYFGTGALTASTTGSGRSIDVPTVTLSGILRVRRFEACAVICDIEGAEIDLIASEIATFQRHVEVFIVEFHHWISGPARITEATRLLIEAGFEEIWQEGNVSVFRNAALSVPTR